MIELKKQYSNNGKLLSYRQDENGREFFYYEDKKTHIIIRQAMPTKEDVRKIKTILPYLRSNELLEELQNVEDESADLIFIVYDSDKILGIAKTVQTDDIGAEADIEFYFENEQLKKAYFKIVRTTFWFMCKDTQKFEHLTCIRGRAKNQIV